MADRGVLDGGVDDLPRAGAVAADQAQQPAVDGLGAGAGEAHLVGAHSEALGHDRAGVVEQQPGRSAWPMQPARVGVPLVERGQQGVPGGRVQRLRGGRVEIDRG